jgi:mono/diheme cytochrome c family protein
MRKPDGGNPVMVVGLFESPAALLRAVPLVREKALGRLEAYTPYPVHGLVKSLGQKPSPLGAMVLVMGILGALSALAFQWWTSVVDYPVPTGGKALFSWQAFVPVMFEVTVLFAAFTAGLAMLLFLNRLPFFGHPLLRSATMKAVTRDRFALAVEADGADLDAAAAESALRGAGAVGVESILEEAEAPWVFRFSSITGLAAACLVAGIATYWGVKIFPITPPMNAMEIQKHAVPYRESPNFKDGRIMRYPAQGTVARGHLPEPALTPEEAGHALVSPLPVTGEVMARGKAKFRIHCQVCHGVLADGETELPSSYGAKAANLQSASIRAYPDGQIYHVIAHGKNTMPAYGADISPDDRWAIVHYIRALQRSQNAKDGDLK